MLWAQIMTPTERLDKLVLDSTIVMAVDGYDMWCFMCEAFVRVEGPFEDTHEWFDGGVRRYLEHVHECNKKTNRE